MRESSQAPGVRALHNRWSSAGVPPLRTGARMCFIVQSSIFGVLLVWLYAAVPPRLAAGPRTAALVWFAGIARRMSRM